MSIEDQVLKRLEAATWDISSVEKWDLGLTDLPSPTACGFRFKHNGTMCRQEATQMVSEEFHKFADEELVKPFVCPKHIHELENDYRTWSPEELEEINASKIRHPSSQELDQMPALSAVQCLSDLEDSDE